MINSKVSVVVKICHGKKKMKITKTGESVQMPRKSVSPTWSKTDLSANQLTQTTAERMSILYHKEMNSLKA